MRCNFGGGDRRKGTARDLGGVINVLLIGDILNGCFLMSSCNMIDGNVKFSLLRYVSFTLLRYYIITLLNLRYYVITLLRY